MTKMLQKRKMAAVCLVAPSLQLGGLENSVAVVANLLSRRGHQVTLVTCYRHERFYRLDDRIDVLEPEFNRADMPGPLFYGRWMIFLRRGVRNVSPHVVLSYGDFHNALVLAALAGTRRPVVISDRASPGLRFPWAVRALRKATYPGAAGIVAQTKRAAAVKQIMTRGRVPIEIIPNSIREFPPHTTVPRERVILAVARHYRVKGLDRLIEAFAESGLDDWSLEIAGSEGPETARLWALINRLGLSQRVRFLGSVKNLTSVYARAGIFVLPSRSEGFPNALIEAMAHGCPAVSFDIDAGPADIIRHGENGLLIPDGDIAALSAALRELAEDESRRRQLGSRARAISEELDPQHIGDRLSAFLQQSAGFPRVQADTLAGSEQT
jgi:glycosyltransferase involved in cell wall biosynthesis